MKRRCESGILIAGCHSQPGVEDTLDESSPPSHRIKCPRGDRARFDHVRISVNPPRALAVMSSAKSFEVRISSKRSDRISTLFNSSDLTISDKKAHFFLLDSINLTCSVGFPIFSANPGNPAPEPKSASRQFSTGIRQLTNMDSPKCRATISRGSSTEVRLTD